MYISYIYVCYYSKNLFNWPRLGSRLVIDNVATCVGFSFLQFLCSVIGFRAGAFPYKKQNTSALCHEPGEPENQYTHCPIDLDSASTRRRALSPTAAFHSFARSRSLSLSLFQSFSLAPLLRRRIITHARHPAWAEYVWHLQCQWREMEWGTERERVKGQRDS